MHPVKPVSKEKEAWQQMLDSEALFPSQEERKKILVISGPTAVGKTALSLEIARLVGGEIVSADSMQVYRGMDIGTAKSSKEEQAIVPHHLIDIRTVRETFHVLDFWQEASLAIEQILAREKLPIIVGGTGFYMHALLYGPPGGPPADMGLRKQLRETLIEQGADFLHGELCRLDSSYASTVSVNDHHKLIRALEIIALTGQKVSSFARRINPVSYNMRCWFLHRPKEFLYERIHERCDHMLEQGLLQEVEYLLQAGLLENHSAAMAIGYRQAIEYLSSPRSYEDLEHFVYCFKQASRKYAKRQFTWFRKESLFRWLDLEEISQDRALEIILQDLECS